MLKLIAVLTMVAAGASCAADDDPVPSGGSGAPAAPAAPVVLEIADVIEREGEPDFLLDAFGSVWSLTADGYLLRLDPDTAELADTFDVGYHSMPACNGDGFDETAVWVCSGPDALARVDPETGEAVTVRARKRTDQTRFPFAAGLLWFLEAGTNDLVGLDGSGVVGGRVPLGLVCTSTASKADTIWVLCPTEGQVLEVDAASAAIVDRLDVLNPRQAAVGDDLFVGSGADLVQVDPDTLEVLHTYEDLGPGTYGDLDATADEVWVRQEGGPVLTAIDPVAHEVTATLDAPEYPGGGDVLITDDWIWASSFDDNVILRVARPSADP